MRDTTRYVIQKMLWVVPLAIAIGLFAGLLASQSDTFQPILGETSEQRIERVRHELGHDKSVLVQYKDYMQANWKTLLIIGASSVIIIGIPYAFKRRTRWKEIG